ncbi:MAG: chromosome partitioning protein ParB, partial [Sphingomonadales bacterium]|nr:chromosome partitioning protein ParB [Sphingomonadales bacterium]
ALEASLIENIARLDPDEVSQWETFTRLIKAGRTPEDIALTFGLPALAVKRVLALGNLLPRIRALYAKGELDRISVRHLTMATKRQQQDWLAAWDDPDRYAPTGHGLKAWLFGGQSIPASHALFDVAASGLATVADLFGEEVYFSDIAAFWDAQNAAIEARREAYLAAGWGEVVIVPPTEHFAAWEYEKMPKRKGGRVYLDVRANGEVAIHEGYVSRREAERAARGDAAGQSEKPTRPELTSSLQTYVDLHRHAAVRVALLGSPGVALRLMVAHLLASSELVSAKADPQTSRDEGTALSLKASFAEGVFGAARAHAKAVLGLDGKGALLSRHHDLGTMFLRLLDLDDEAVLDLIAVLMGESLAVGSIAVDAAGLHLGLDMADFWEADEALFDLLRDKEVLVALVGDVAGEPVARANAKEKGKALKTIIRNHLDGADGR